MRALEAERAQHEAQLAELNRTVSELGLQPRPAAVAGSHTEVRLLHRSDETP